MPVGGEYEIFEDVKQSLTAHGGTIFAPNGQKNLN